MMPWQPPGQSSSPFCAQDLDYHDPTAFTPFSEDTARIKVRAAEDAWNSRDPSIVVAAYSKNSQWRHRVEFFGGHDEIEAFLNRKWTRENITA